MSDIEFHAVAKMGDLDEGEALQVIVGRKEIAIYNIDGEFYATDDICTHAYASLADGYVEGELIECPLATDRSPWCVGADRPTRKNNQEYQQTASQRPWFPPASSVTTPLNQIPADSPRSEKPDHTTRIGKPSPDCPARPIDRYWQGKGRCVHSGAN